MNLIFCLLVFFGYAQAFCIYNRSTRYLLHVRQLEVHVAGKKRHRFEQRIAVSNRACCHFTERHCNSPGDPNTVVEFIMQRQSWTGEDKYESVGVLFSVTAPAGGWVAIEDDAEPFVYYADGSPFPYTYHVNEKY